MGKSQRLTSNKQFSLIHSEGKSWANHLLVLKILSNCLSTNRYGFLIGKRLGTAVRRNYIRRRLKEILRLTDIQSGWDIIIIARRDSRRATGHQIKQATERLLAKADILSVDGRSVNEHIALAANK